MSFSVIGLKERLVGEHAILARELKKTVKNKMELEEIIRNLSYEVSCLARHWQTGKDEMNENKK